MKALKKAAEALIRIYTDGSGCRPDGKGSGFAWLRQDTGERKITREDGLTNNQAEYRAILAALESLPKGSTAEILTDSENTCFQLKGHRSTLGPKLAELNEKIRTLCKAKNLSVTFIWIPRKENLAGKLLESWKCRKQTGSLTYKMRLSFLAFLFPTLYGWAWQRRIPFVKVGRALRFDRVDLERFVQAHRHEARK